MYCPCQSGKDYDECCGRFISHHKHAENAQLLMRSRYSAYVLDNSDYILDTWHPDFRPMSVKKDKELHWLRLDILESNEQDDQAVVEFEARLLIDKYVNSLHERSSFVREEGRWFYTSGEKLEPTFKSWKPARKEPCPCGSGLKYKRCCEVHSV